MRSIIPNSLTALNLFCGLLGITFAFNEMLEYSGVMIFIAALFDFLDGLSARLLNARSAIGKELDSLADVVSFGVLPGVMLYQFIVISKYQYYTPLLERDPAYTLMACVGLLVPIFAALRLAKFNTDDTQSKEFIGLPTPAAAIVVASYALIMGFQVPVNMYYPPQGGALRISMAIFYQDTYDFTVFYLMFEPLTHIFTSVILCALMVSPIRMFSLKFESFSFKKNKLRYSFLIFSLLLILYAFAHYFFIVPGSLTLEYSSLVWIMILYILISIFRHIFTSHEIQS